MLDELWAALGRDPFVIAECLARPLLAERRLRMRIADCGLRNEGCEPREAANPQSAIHNPQFEEWWSGVREPISLMPGQGRRILQSQLEKDIDDADQFSQSEVKSLKRSNQMSPALSQAEAIIGSLSYQERLWLIEWLARQLRAQAPPADFQRQIALMAADAAIQAELKAIEQEFASVEEERPLYETATPEELAQAFMAWAHSHSNNSPGLTLEDVSRETIYEDR